jgi:hypothetical protein
MVSSTCASLAARLPGDGRETAGGRLLRSDNLQELSPSDLAMLVRDIGVTTVVDLRSSVELASEGPAPLDAVPGVQHAHHPVILEIGAGHEEAAVAALHAAGWRALSNEGLESLCQRFGVEV